MGISYIGWLGLLILGGVIFYQIFGLDESFDPMLAASVDFDIKKPEPENH